jgi:glycosyltransferase involved in cell wall biosynthesis
LREPLVQRQVVPYLAEVRQELDGVWLLTFERTHPRLWDKRVVNGLLETLQHNRLSWSYLRYHKSPTIPATTLDIILGSLRVARLAKRHGVGVVHCRGHVAMAMGALAKRFCRTLVVFDIRGFMPEEYVDAGVWPAGGGLFRVTKRVERHLMQAADAFVVLTERARQHLFPGCGDVDIQGRPISVIPCCVDARGFPAPDVRAVQQAKAAVGVLGRRVYVYLGQLGGWYLDEVLVEFLARARIADPAAYALIITPSPTSEFRKRLAARAFDDSNSLVTFADPAEVPKYLLAGDVGLSFIKPCFSKISSSPTKIAEYLSAGLPVVSTTGIGDLDAFLTENRAGHLLSSFDGGALDDGIGKVNELLTEGGLRQRLRQLAETALGLQTVGGPRYRHLYRCLDARNTRVEKRKGRG